MCPLAPWTLARRASRRCKLHRPNRSQGSRRRQGSSPPGMVELGQGEECSETRRSRMYPACSLACCSSPRRTPQQCLTKVYQPAGEGQVSNRRVIAAVDRCPTECRFDQGRCQQERTDAAWTRGDRCQTASDGDQAALVSKSSRVSARQNSSMANSDIRRGWNLPSTLCTDKISCLIFSTSTMRMLQS